jgi:hypothetical protein
MQDSACGSPVLPIKALRSLHYLTHSCAQQRPFTISLMFTVLVFTTWMTFYAHTHPRDIAWVENLWAQPSTSDTWTCQSSINRRSIPARSAYKHHLLLPIKYEHFLNG